MSKRNSIQHSIRNSQSYISSRRLRARQAESWRNQRWRRLLQLSALFHLLDVEKHNPRVSLLLQGFPLATPETSALLWSLRTPALYDPHLIVSKRITFFWQCFPLLVNEEIIPVFFPPSCSILWFTATKIKKKKCHPRFFFETRLFSNKFAFWQIFFFPQYFFKTYWGTPRYTKRQF